MKRWCFKWIGCLCGLVILASCNHEYPGYQRTSDGLYYRIIETDTTHSLPSMGDFLKLKMDYYLNDSLLYSSAVNEEYPRIQMKQSESEGDILSGLAMMREGDSASFIVRTGNDNMRYEIRLEKIQSREDFLAEVEAVYEDMKTASEQELKSYIVDNQINVKPTEQGVYYWTTRPGKGVKPNPGDLVEVHYEGRFLDGTLFDSVYRVDSTFSFILGKGYLIPAWEEVVPMMRLGECATMLVPYPMAYGDRSVGAIPPYANLIYNIEIQNIIDSKIVESEYEERMKALKAQSESDFKTYLETHHITETPTASGLYIIPQKKGKGRHAGSGMIARIKYEARTLDGNLLGYGESPYQDVKIGDGTLMAGVEEGLKTMSEGDSVTLVMPYHLAYGAFGSGNIAPYTNVVLNMVLIQLFSEQEYQ